MFSKYGGEDIKDHNYHLIQSVLKLEAKSYLKKTMNLSSFDGEKMVVTGGVNDRSVGKWTQSKSPSS